MGLNTIGTALQGPDGVPFGLTHTDHALDVVLNDSTTPLVLMKMHNVHSVTALAVAVEHDPDVLQYEITVDDATDIVAGSYLVVFDETLNRYSTFTALSKLLNVVTLDTPIDVSYPVDSVVSISSTNMAVNGSVTPVIFGVRGAGVSTGIDITIDVTRIIITCLTTGATTLATFGDLAALTRGLVFRKRNGETFNIFNVKTNGELAGITLDFIVYEADNPVFGQNGFVSRLTFSGQEKLGAVIRLPRDEDLEVIVQDNLVDLILLEVVAEGSLTSTGQE